MLVDGRGVWLLRPEILLGGGLNFEIRTIKFKANDYLIIKATDGIIFLKLIPEIFFFFKLRNHEILTKRILMILRYCIQRKEFLHSKYLKTLLIPK